MKKLDQYLLREMFIPFLVGTFAVVLMFQANAYMFIGRNYNLENIPVLARLQWILYMTPGYLEMTLPVGTALAASLALTRLTRESELTAMRAAGIRILRAMLPVFAFGVVVSVANFYIVDRVVPVSTQRANGIFAKNAFLGMSNVFKSNAFIQLDRFAASMGTVRRDPQDRLHIDDILLVERTNGASITTMIQAKSGIYDRGVWTFRNPTLYYIEDGDIKTAHAIGDSVISQPIDFNQFFSGNLSATVQEQTTDDLRRSIRAAQLAHTEVRPAELELAKRYAVPASCAIFAVTSPIFAIYFARSGGFAGILVSFVVLVVYYNAFIISADILGKAATVPVWVAAWLPNMVFGALGVLGYRRLE